METSVTRENILKALFIALFVQMQIILFASLPAQAGPVFVKKFFFGFDFYDFFGATDDWLHHVNPYLRSRFVTPPGSLLIGLIFHPFGFQVGRVMFFMANLLLVFLSIWMICKKLKMSPLARKLMAGIAAVFYPTFFLLERENIDGVMLALLTASVMTESLWLRALLIGISINLKLYSAVLLLPMLIRGQWKLLLSTLLVTLLVFLPFAGLFLPFLSSLAVRSAGIAAIENISPAAILGTLAIHLPAELLYFFIWAGTLIYWTWRQKNTDGMTSVLACFPWMCSFPLHVYPYTGVLLLPVLAHQIQRVRFSRISIPEKLFFSGFFLVGLQQKALTDYFRWLVYSHRFFPVLNTVGMIFVLVGLVSAKQENQDDLPGGSGFTFEASGVRW